MEEQVQEISKWSHSLKARLHIFAYIIAGIFLYIKGGELSDVLIQAVGIAFFTTAFLILIGQLPCVVLKKIAKFADGVSSFGLYIATLVIFITAVIDWANETERIAVLWAIPVVLLAFIVYDIIDIVKNTRTMARSIGKKATASRQLKRLSFLLTFLVLLMLVRDIQGIGKPVFWLTPAFISLMIALCLDGTFRNRSGADA
jgi:hypothetical protein